MTNPAWQECLSNYRNGQEPDRAAEKAAVKHTLAVLAGRAPGYSVEVRVPPYAAVQVLEGVRHRRGTPPAMVECAASTWLQLAAGELDWGDAIADGRLRASGERSDLSHLLPL